MFPPLFEGLEPPFFDALAPLSQSALLKTGRTRRFETGTCLAFEGDPSHSLFVIRSGLLRVERNTTAGRQVLMTLSGPGDLWGELGVLEGLPRSATAWTMQPTECLEISAAAFFEVITAHPDILLSMTRSISSRLRSLSDQFVQSSDREIIARVAARLVDLITRMGLINTVAPVDVVMPISQQELGQWAGLSREGTSKALRQLRESGVLTTGRRRITVLDPDRLLDIAARSL